MGFSMFYIGHWMVNLNPSETFSKLLFIKIRNSSKPFDIIGDFNLSLLDHKACRKVQNVLDVVYLFIYLFIYFLIFWFFVYFLFISFFDFWLAQVKAVHSLISLGKMFQIQPTKNAVSMSYLIGWIFFDVTFCTFLRLCSH